MDSQCGDLSDWTAGGRSRDWDWRSPWVPSAQSSYQCLPACSVWSLMNTRVAEFLGCWDLENKFTASQDWHLARPCYDLAAKDVAVLVNPCYAYAASDGKIPWWRHSTRRHAKETRECPERRWVLVYRWRWYCSPRLVVISPPPRDAMMMNLWKIIIDDKRIFRRQIILELLYLDLFTTLWSWEWSWDIDDETEIRREQN